MNNFTTPTVKKIKSFTDLEAWRKGHELVLAIYQMTKEFPKEERYGLIDQLRRASVSITSNIAEGFGRISNREKAQFFMRSMGSLAEVQNQLLIARDVGYIDEQNFQKLAERSVLTSKIINGLLKHAQSKVLY